MPARTTKPQELEDAQMEDVPTSAQPEAEEPAADAEEEEEEEEPEPQRVRIVSVP